MPPAASCILGYDLLGIRMAIVARRQSVARRLRLALLQLALAGEPPAEAVQLAVAAVDAMAGDDDRYGVRGTGAANRAGGRRRSDGARDLGVRSRVAERDALSLLADAPLEGR